MRLANPRLGLEGKQVNAAVKFLMAMYEAFTRLDASIVEINPLVVTGAGEVIALDAKMNFDDNALFRHADIAALRDERCQVVGEPQDSEYGKFGWVLDPGGNKIELWEPPKA